VLEPILRWQADLRDMFGTLVVRRVFYISAIFGNQSLRFIRIAALGIEKLAGEQGRRPIGVH
jgi:hypothetical protein